MLLALFRFVTNAGDLSRVPPCQTETEAEEKRTAKGPVFCSFYIEAYDMTEVELLGHLELKPTVS